MSLGLSARVSPPSASTTPNVRTRGHVPRPASLRVALLKATPLIEPEANSVPVDLSSISRRKPVPSETGAECSQGQIACS